MKKISKILLIIFLLGVCVFSSNVAFAAIDMNLTSNGVSNTSTANSSTTNSAVANSSSDTNSKENSISNEVANQTNTATNSSATVSNLSSLPESELGLTNILNILLIAVGFVLILLGIAIIIKLKK